MGPVLTTVVHLGRTSVLQVIGNFFFIFATKLRANLGSQWGEEMTASWGTLQIQFNMISRDKKLIKWAKGIVCLQIGIVRVRLYQTFSLFFGYHTLCSRHVTTVQRHNLRTRAPSLSWRPSTPNMKYETGNRIPS